MAATATNPRAYISPGKAGELLGIGPRTFQRVAERAGIGRMKLPGMPTRYSRADVEALLERSIERHGRGPDRAA